METSIQTQLIALAALCQAAKLVQNVARTSESQHAKLELILGSVVNLNPATPLDIYGGELANLREGFELIVEQLGDKQKKDVELTRYLVGVLGLERRLHKTPKNMSELGQQLSQLERQLQHFTVTDDTIVGKLADIYSDCISSLGARIQIYGQPELLSQSSVQHKVRALLLAAVRAAVLWRQAGGSRLHFIFKRRKLLAAAEAALASL
ncbi:high frequency lysogenization protein HflD [Alishewanella tabrizica]|uniref:High frequency lysogenization protein HflD homolog n=1 Tax=Alishewanella tabrizica TaxID=671278 RepID=A0ABQ2WUF4_9ALTE|nr:high frequency lysogenization protein HflD [Alishewanella tabrizica]GGW70819.1 high frequency lysogenization protein HflD [Alishewanella tabrizica]